MEISQRLMTVAGMVQYDTLADIGTDHGYVPIYLVKKGLVKKAIACDINKGPIDKADKNIKSYNLQNCIQTRLGSGFMPIKPYEVSTGVVAGMGGMLIIDILKNSPDVIQSLSQLVLQPQLDIYEVRKFVHSIGFKIIDEKMVFEDGKFYTVINCVKGSEKYDDPKDYLFGKTLIDKKDDVLKQFLNAQIQKLDFIMDSVKNKNTANSLARYNQALSEKNMCLEVLKCL